MANKSKFWDRWAKRYAKRQISNQDSYQKKLDVTRRYLTPDTQVFEFGCGTGSTALLHAPFTKHIRATDFSQKMIEIAQAKAKAQGIANVSFEQAEIMALSAPDGFFDMVMGHSILHLLDDRDPVIAKVFQLLKPGGVFVSSTVCLGGIGAPLRLLLKAGGSIGLLPPINFFGIDALLASMTGAGFDIDYQMASEGSKVIFVVARKPG